MILIKAVIKEKVKPNAYVLETQDGELIQASFPLKLLMNYIKIEIGDEMLIILSSAGAKDGKFATKYDFINYPELIVQKKQLDFMRTESSQDE